MFHHCNQNQECFMVFHNSIWVLTQLEAEQILWFVPGFLTATLNIFILF